MVSIRCRSAGRGNGGMGGGRGRSGPRGVLARDRTPATAGHYGRDEAMLVDEARRLRLDDFARMVAYWSAHAHPDGAEADAATLRARRRSHLSDLRRDLGARPRGRGHRGHHLGRDPADP